MSARVVYLYVPGNSPSLIYASLAASADVVVLDLEDAVAPHKKHEARHLTAEALRSLPWKAWDGVAVRVNPPSTEHGRLDIQHTVRAGVRLIRVPKVESDEDIEQVDVQIGVLEHELRLERYSVRLIASIESARGLLNAPQIATCSKRLDALSLGGEDLSADMGAIRSKRGTELGYARAAVVCAARAAGIVAIDSVFPFLDDEQSLFEDAKNAADIGFDAKSVISPGQVDVVRRAFYPSDEEIVHAEKIVESARRLSGVHSVGGSMVDAPVVKRAWRILDRRDMMRGRHAYEWKS